MVHIMRREIWTTTHLFAIQIWITRPEVVVVVDRGREGHTELRGGHDAEYERKGAAPVIRVWVFSVITWRLQ